MQQHIKISYLQKWPTNISSLISSTAENSELGLEALTVGYSSQLSAEHIVYDSHGANGISDRGMPSNGEGRA